MDDDVVEVMARGMFPAFWGEPLPDVETVTWENCNATSRDRFNAMARAALAALEKKGYAVVPVEPTEEMVSAAFAHVYPVDRRRALQAVIDVIAARPKCAA